VQRSPALQAAVAVRASLPQVAAVMKILPFRQNSASKKVLAQKSCLSGNGDSYENIVFQAKTLNNLFCKKK